MCAWTAVHSACPQPQRHGTGAVHSRTRHAQRTHEASRARAGSQSNSRAPHAAFPNCSACSTHAWWKGAPAWCLAVWCGGCAQHLLNSCRAEEEGAVHTCATPQHPCVVAGAPLWCGRLCTAPASPPRSRRCAHAHAQRARSTPSSYAQRGKPPPQASKVGSHLPRAKSPQGRPCGRRAPPPRPYHSHRHPGNKGSAHQCSHLRHTKSPSGRLCGLRAPCRGAHRAGAHQPPSRARARACAPAVGEGGGEEWGGVEGRAGHSKALRNVGGRRVSVPTS